MAKKSLKIKQKIYKKFSVRNYTRCQKCGRPRSVIKKFQLCRLCFRKMALEAKLPGIQKSSW